MSTTLRHYDSSSNHNNNEFMAMESPEAAEAMTTINNYNNYSNDNPRSITSGEEEEDTNTPAQQQRPSAAKPMTTATSLFRRFSPNKAAATSTAATEEETNTTNNNSAVIDQQSRAAAAGVGATTNTTSTTAHAQSSQRLLTTREDSLELSESSSSSTSDEAPIVFAARSTTTTNISKPRLFRSLSLFGKLRRCKSSAAKANGNGKRMNQTYTCSGGSPENVVQWLEAACPRDVVPKVLAYCGPQMTATLMKTNRFWFQLIANEDATWRPLCEGMCKWKEGRDKPPSSWKQYYRSHPCVPIDYSTIPKAMAVATPPKKKKAAVRHYHNKREQIKNVRILLRPGKHYVKESVLIEAASCVTVTLETMQLPDNRFYNPRLAYQDQRGPQSYPEQRTSTAASLKQLLWMNCTSQTEAVDSDYESVDGSDDSPLVFWNDSNRSHHQSSNNIYSTEPPKYPDRASLILQTKKQNEPVIRVRQGSLKLKQVDLHHACNGVDIWTGQAALQVQPPLNPDGIPIATGPRPWATVDNCSITSKSGRGVVCLDGGYLTMRDSLIYDCAATGIYVGGPGSQADVEQTDVVRNGIGSRLAPSRTPRVSSGHSGVYLEQGLVRLHACNISSNFLTGISAISPDNAVLLLQKSDLIANGQCNLEMPPPGTSAYRQSVLEENNVASVGRPALRSNLELPNSGNRFSGSF